MTKQEAQTAALERTRKPSWRKAKLVDGGGLGRGDADEAAAAATIFELDVTSDQREERVVLALTDIFTGLMLGAALANQNRAGIDELSAEAFYAESLTVRIAAVC